MRGRRRVEGGDGEGTGEAREADRPWRFERARGELDEREDRLGGADDAVDVGARVRVVGAHELAGVDQLAVALVELDRIAEVGRPGDVPLEAEVAEQRGRDAEAEVLGSV